jgi:hypothetical protein
MRIDDTDNDERFELSVCLFKKFLHIFIILKRNVIKIFTSVIY